VTEPAEQPAAGLVARPAAGLVVRPVAARDSVRWRELFAAYGAFYGTTFAPGVLDGVWAWLMDDAHPVRALVAERDGVVIGFAHVRDQPDTFTAGPSWFLDDLFTDPSSRGTGAATALLGAIEEHARAEGGGTVRWITGADNSAAQRLYDRVATRTTWVTYEREVTTT
jgi:GNAT superfamily N-acetyltransferase